MDKTIYNPHYRHLIMRLRVSRERCNMTQRTASVRLGAARSWVGKIETCELRLDVLGLARLARLYETDAGRLIGQLQEDLSQEDDPVVTEEEAAEALIRIDRRVGNHALARSPER